MTDVNLTDLASVFSEFSDELDTYIKSLDDPFSPVARQLREADTHLALAAATISRLAVEQMAADVTAAVSDLGVSVSKAKDTLKEIDGVSKALSLVSAILSVAVSVSSGNILGAATNVLALVDVVNGATKANS